MKKIYIIGHVGSGKSTLAKVLSKKYKIPYYELDKIVWNDLIGIKRNKEETIKIFNNIINKKSFIIEDVGRDIFKEGIKKSEIIYYIKLNKIRLYYRVTKRWIKQKFNLEQYNYNPTIKSLSQMFIWLHNDIKKIKIKIKNILKNNSNLIILNKRKIKKLIKE